MFIIYALRDCEYCELAVEELSKRHKSFYYYPVDEDRVYKNSLSLNELKDKYSWPTVPIILKITNKVEELVGGYDDLMIYLEEENEKR
tara:strand:- start:1078 stop:1341 length:264 start_codon:yes stop_codon:yes gene_type:complete